MDFVLKIIEGLQDYLSCEVHFFMNKKIAWLEQPHLIKGLKKRHRELWKISADDQNYFGPELGWCFILSNIQDLTLQAK